MRVHSTFQDAGWAPTDERDSVTHIYWKPAPETIAPEVLPPVRMFEVEDRFTIPVIAPARASYPIARPRPEHTQGMRRSVSPSVIVAVTPKSW